MCTESSKGPTSMYWWYSTNSKVFVPLHSNRIQHPSTRSPKRTATCFIISLSKYVVVNDQMYF